MSLGKSLITGMREAVAFAEGTADVSHYGVHVPPSIDVKAIREKLCMTQKDFAAAYGFSVNTLRQWERRNRVPEGPTRAYLLVIDRAPQLVRDVLASPAR
jgi:putative transcriptional regulator